jgi:hypothetical protein
VSEYKARRDEEKEEVERPVESEIRERQNRRHRSRLQLAPRGMRQSGRVVCVFVSFAPPNLEGQ